MKKFWITFIMLMLTFSFSIVSAAPRHRHHPQLEATAPAPRHASPTPVNSKANSPNQSMDAYSDTTSAADADDEDSVEEASDSNQSNDNPNHTMIYWFDKVMGGTVGVGGILFAMLVVILVFLFLTSPLIVIALIVWWLIKRKNKRMDLAQKAIENGRPIPESEIPVEKQSDKYLLKRGARNGFLGLGLMMMFWFWHAPFLAGIAALVFIYGAGQAFIAWASMKDALHLGGDKEQKAGNASQNPQDHTEAEGKMAGDQDDSAASDADQGERQGAPEGAEPNENEPIEKEPSEKD